MALGPAFPDLSMFLFSWLEVVRREKLFSLNWVRSELELEMREQFWTRIEEGENGK